MCALLRKSQNDPQYLSFVNRNNTPNTYRNGTGTYQTAYNKMIRVLNACKDEYDRLVMSKQHTYRRDQNGFWKKNPGLTLVHIMRCVYDAFYVDGCSASDAFSLYRVYGFRSLNDGLKYLPKNTPKTIMSFLMSQASNTPTKMERAMDTTVVYIEAQKIH